MSWTAPANMGASGILSYEVTSSPEGIVMTTADGNTTMTTITGLTNGVTYTFTVTAKNGNGTGLPSAPSNPVTPTAVPMVPSAPTMVVAVADVDKGAHVSWRAADNHGSPLTGYAVSVSPSIGAPTMAAASASSIIVSGLTPGTSYTFTVAAANAIGDSAASTPSNSIVAGTKPQPPTGAVAAADVDHGATISWVPPTDTGYSPIVNYTVTAVPGGMTVTTTNGIATSVAMSGLTAGQPYSFSVVATNLFGASTPSAASSAVTVQAKLAAPTNVVACGANGQLRVRFDTVVGATSYNIYYNSVLPSTSGTKTTVASSPYTITLPNGSYYVSVAAVNGVGDGVSSVDQSVTASTVLHDALFVGADQAIDIYDCYSKLPNGAAPSRSLTPNIAGFFMLPYTAFAVDGMNGAIYVADDTNQRIRIWLNASTVTGSTAPNFSLGGATNTKFAGPGGVAIDPLHKALYVSDGTIKRFNYSAISDLNGDVAPNAVLSEGAGSAFQLFVNPANGDLWSANFHTSGGGGGGACQYAAAYGLPNPSSYTKVITFAASMYNDYVGMAYSSAAGGTLYLADGVNSEPNPQIRWISGVDALANGPHSQDGSLLGTFTSLAIAGTRIVATTNTSVATAVSWDLSALSGSSTKSVSSSRAVGGGVVYVP